MKKYVFALFVLFIVLTGCSQKDSLKPQKSGNHETADKAFEQGKLALANEDFNKAKNSFELAVEENKRSEAEGYLDTMDLVEKFINAYEQDELEEANELHVELQEDPYYSKIEFILDGMPEDLELLMEIRADIDEQIEGLIEFYDPDKRYMPSELYLAESQDILDEYYISTEQANKIYEWREAAEVEIDYQLEKIEREINSYE